jgi:ATP-dependent DNA helicase RecG
MYQLTDSILAVKGVGEKLQEKLSPREIESILDFLLFLPLKYEDRSQIYQIADVQKINNSYLVDEIPDQKGKKTDSKKVKKNFITIKAKVKTFSEYRKGRLLISRASIEDETGRLNCIWFNNRFLKNKIQKGKEYYFSGEYKKDSLSQASVEEVKEENLHTARLVPVYPSLGDIKQGNLRRIYKEIIDKLKKAQDPLEQMDFDELFKNLHFPNDEEKIIEARERLSLEEILYLIEESRKIKEEWQKNKIAKKIAVDQKNKIPKTIPFSLTAAQEKAVNEILEDLNQEETMNRLLVGDVGSGKTIVAAIAAYHNVKNGENACLIAPTQILAQQHFQNLSKIFPDVGIELITASNSKNFEKSSTAKIYVGTHAILNKVAVIKPNLVIYDEQQRFGVGQRSIENFLEKNKTEEENKVQAFPHLLTMTATPIPRTLMLTIFAHLKLSYLDQMPNNRQIAKTWLVPQKKEKAAIEWLVNEIKKNPKQKKQAIIICPFIDPSSHQALENVAAANGSFKAIKKQVSNISGAEDIEIGLLHSRLKKKEQTQVIEDVFAEKIQVLVSTPMVEVGVDLPNADIIVIQAAERFGLSSLHQLRGRVGRQGQASYCLLFSSNENLNQNSKKRLEYFCDEHDGLKLAEADLDNRGAGDLFGLRQSGFSNLQFASWTNTEIIQQAQKISETTNYHSALSQYFLERNKKNSKSAGN